MAERMGARYKYLKELRCIWPGLALSLICFMFFILREKTHLHVLLTLMCTENCIVCYHLLRSVLLISPQSELILTVLCKELYDWSELSGHVCLYEVAAVS